MFRGEEVKEIFKPGKKNNLVTKYDLYFGYHKTPSRILIPNT